MSIQAQIASFLEKSEQSKTLMKTAEAHVNALCESVQAILFVIGSSGDSALDETDLKKLLVPREDEGHIEKRMEFVMKGLNLSKRIILDHYALVAVISGRQAEPSPLIHPVESTRPPVVSPQLANQKKSQSVKDDPIPGAYPEAGRKSPKHRGPKPKRAPPRGYKTDLLNFFAFS
jgi:hypothetical protein